MHLPIPLTRSGRWLLRALKLGARCQALAWGLIEDRLTTELSELWNETLRTPNLDLDAAIQKRMASLAQRLDLVLGQY